MINLAPVVSLFVAVVLALAFTPVPLAQAQGDDPTDGWSKHNIDANLDGANSVYVCDINSDGDPDLVATGGAAHDVVWYEAPTWTRHSIDASLPAACAVYVSDIDTDGDPDVVASGNSTVVWYENPTWTKHDIDSLSGAYGFAVYDIDSDGDPDVVATGANVAWYEAPDDPTTAWTRHDIDTSPRLSSKACVYDIDSDGDVDVAATDWWHGEVVWYEAPTDPTGTWTTHGIDTDLLGASGVYIYDINADGKCDVVAAGYLADDVVWYKAPVDPVTGTWIKYDIDTNLDGATDVYVHDMDVDGDPDIVTTGYNADDVVWYEAPYWTKHYIDTDLNGAGGAYIHDIDSDGNPDVVATGYFADDVVWYRIEWESYKTDYFPAGDACDNFSDYVTEHTVYMYGTAFKRAPNPTGAWAKHDIDTELDGCAGVYVHDIDGDGNSDMVATAQFGDDVVWYEAPDNPVGTWSKHNIDTDLNGARGAHVHDIDSDGNPDVVAGGYDASDVVWYQAPDDPTDSWVKYNIDTDLSGAWGVYVYDIDTDGNPDVVAAGWGAGDVVWYEAPDDPTTGSWTRRTINTTSLDGAGGVCVHDIDTDGNPDVVAAGSAADEVMWYEAPDDAATGSWTGHSIYADLNGAWEVYVHDMDSDGNPDVIATGIHANDAVWCEGPDDPTGSWTKHSIDPALTGATGVYVHDIDSDGSPDIIASGSSLAGTGAVMWYEFPHSGGKDYKVIFWEGTTTQRQTEIVTAQDGTVKSQQTFVAGIHNPGTWYAGVYDVDYEPSSYNDNVIWTDSFIVEQSTTIPSPDIRTPIDSIDFGCVATGASWDNITTIYNDGSTDLVISNITRLSGSDKFTYVGSATPFYIEPGDSQVITIRFAPTSVGAKSATFNIDSNDPDLPDITFDVSGNGAVPAVYYVSPTGDDTTGDGSEGAPWRTITKAVTVASDCDIIRVMDDDVSTVDYTENVDVHKQLAIERYNDTGPNPQIEALSTTDHVFHVSASKVIIRGLDISGASDPYMSGIYLDGVDHCGIQNNRCWGNGYGIRLSNSSLSTISDNVCEFNLDSGISLSGGVNNTLTNNRANENTSGDADLPARVPARGSGIELWGSNYNTLIGNTASGNTATAGLYAIVGAAYARGISLEGSNFNTLVSNTADDNEATSGTLFSFGPADAYGIYLGGSDFNTVVSNTANSNSAHGFHSVAQSSGICVWGSSSNTIAKNEANDSYASTAPGSASYGYGIYVRDSTDNTITSNTANSNFGGGVHGWGIYLWESTSNLISKNTINDTWGHSIGLYDSSNDNAIYLNNFATPYAPWANIGSDSTNDWSSPTPLCYEYASTPHRSYMGNYYDDHAGADTDNDGICDDPYYYTTDNGNDQNPLWQASGNYSLFAWWLGNPGTMYKGDMSKGPGTVTVRAGSSVTWIADQAAPSDITFPAGQGWTGQVVFTSPPEIGDSFAVEIGSSDGGFAPGGPQAILAGDGSTTTFTYTTSNASFTVHSGHYLALRITSGYTARLDVRVGGAWSYTSVPDVGAPPPPDIRTPIDPIDFGNVRVGSSPVERTTIHNDGPTTLTINDIIRTSGSDEFTYNGPTTPFYIMTGGSQNVYIRFAPTSAGAKSATFNVNSNDADEPDVTFDVSGNGTVPDIRTPIDPIDFGDVEVGSALNETTIIYNDGSATLTINDITTASGSEEFDYVSPEIPFGISPGGGRSITIQFAPTSTGAKSATFNVNSNDPVEPDVTFDVSGTGTSPTGIQIDLKAGWNVVSIPVTPIDNSTSAVFPGVAGVFTWNATDGSYYEPAVIEPEKGYWVAVIDDTAITINGNPIETWTTNIKAGWNMIGSVNITTSIADPNDNPDSSVIPPAYWWDAVGRSYVLTTDIGPGKGYWVASVNDCVLTL